ncbi:microcephalin [Lampris incognitus]|uniref:microcephalin n=1 Tax=Lampris incognitus TaxID=2546036 RepID=UPI0024B5A41C|nr:microcephalin [Lampris incognitus]
MEKWKKVVCSTMEVIMVVAPSILTATLKAALFCSQALESMPDLLSKLNELNYELQGKDEDAAHTAVNAFKTKVGVWASQLRNGRLVHYPNPEKMSQNIGNKDEFLPQEFCTHPEKLASEFNGRFQELNDIGEVAAFISNPFLPIEIEEVPAKFQQAFALPVEVDMGITDLQNDIELKASSRNSDFWDLVNTEKFPLLSFSTLKVKAYFGSTYLCEMAFSQKLSGLTMAGHGSSAILKDVVAYVDVWSSDKTDNYSKPFVKQLQELGAEVSKTFNKQVTHVVFKNGHQATWVLAKKRGSKLVSVLWVARCKEDGEHVDEELFPALNDELNSVFKKRTHRCMQPRHSPDRTPTSDRRMRKKLDKMMKDLAAKTTPVKDLTTYVIDEETGIVYSPSLKRSDSMAKRLKEMREKREALSPTASQMPGSSLSPELKPSCESIPTVLKFSSDEQRDDESTASFAAQLDELYDQKKESKNDDINHAHSEPQEKGVEEPWLSPCRDVPIPKLFFPSKFPDLEDEEKGTKQNRKSKRRSVRRESAKKPNTLSSLEIPCQDIGSEDPSAAMSAAGDDDDGVFEDFFSPANHQQTQQRLLLPSLCFGSGVQIPFELEPVTKKRKQSSSRATGSESDQSRGSKHTAAAGVTEASTADVQCHNQQLAVTVKKMGKETKTVRTLVMTSMPTEKQGIVIQVVRALGGFSIIDQVRESTTHVVSGGHQRTVNVLLGIARGCWILSFEWILSSLEQRRWIPEEPYELSDYFPAATICRLQKHLSAGEHQQDLFQDQPAMFVSQYSQPPTHILVELIQLFGGTVCRTIRQAGICIGKYNGRRPEGTRILSEQWVLDCITHLKQLSSENYNLE